MSQINRRYFESLMEGKKLSLRGLAAKIGLNHSQLSLTFSGGRRMTLDEAAKLSNLFGVPLHKIVEAAGVSVKPVNGKRVSVIGAMRGDGTVEMHKSNHVERTSAPEDMPPDTVAIQARTAGSALDWMDSWVFFCRKHDGMEHEHLGRVCLAQIAKGPTVIAMVRRGYVEGTFNLSGAYTKDSAELVWATPIVFTRN